MTTARNPLAYVYDFALVGAGCVFGHFSIIGQLPSRHAALARETEQTECVILGDNVSVGARSTVFAGARIGDGTFIGDGSTVREGSTVGRNCVIGQNVAVSHDVVIGDNVRIMTGTHITGGMVIGDGSFIGVNVTTSNDKRPEVIDYQYDFILPPVVGKRVLIGSGANILPGVRIGDGAVIGAGALVTKDVPSFARVLGAPARIEAMA